MGGYVFKRCPHCGRTEGFQIKPVWKDYRFVACKCKATGPVAKDEDGAVRLWNERAGETCEYTLEYDREEQERRRKAHEAEPYGLFPQDMPGPAWTCSNCGQQWTAHHAQDQDGRPRILPPPEWMRCCPNCGARIAMVVTGE